MEILFETDVYRYGWHDKEHTIVVLEILSRWNWDDAYKVICGINELHRLTSNDTFTILHFHGHFGVIPQGRNGLPILKYLVSQDPPNEKLLFIVTKNRLLEILLNSISKAYGLAPIVKKYRYSTTMDEALSAIAAFRSQNCTIHKTATASKSQDNIGSYH